MRTDLPDDPTVDPVERERKLMARERALVTRERPARRLPSLSRLSMLLSLVLVTAYLVVWAGTVQGSGGPEGYVRNTDFVATLTGALIIREGNGPNLYDRETQKVAQGVVLSPYKAFTDDNMLPYNHPPFEALLVAPLMDLRPWFAFAAWTLVAGLAVGVSVGLLDSALPVSRQTGWALSLAACSYLPLLRSLMLGQNSAFVLLGFSGLFMSLKRGWHGWAALSLALIALKPQVLPVVVLVLLLQRRWRVLALFGGLMVEISVIAMLVLGLDWPMRYAQLLLGAAGWEDNGAIDPSIMQNWRGFVTGLFGGWAPGLVVPLFVALSVASLALVVWAWARSRTAPLPATYESPASGDLDEAYHPAHDLLWALAGIVTLLISFHLNPHDLALLIFPAWITGAYAAAGHWGVGLSRLWFGLLWVEYALAPLTLFSGNPTLAVVPGVLVMAFASVLLALQLAYEGAPGGEFEPLTG